MAFVLSIRPAVPNDAQSIFECIQGFAKRFGVIEGRSVLSYIKTEGAVQRIADQLCLENPPFQCLMAETKDNPIGCALYYPGFSDWTHSSYPWLEDLYAKDVDTVGDNNITRKELVKVLVRDAQKRDAPRIETRSLVKHADTRIFYTEELGMHITSEWKSYRMELPSAVPVLPPKDKEITVRLAERSDLRQIAMFIQNSANVQGVPEKVNRRSVMEKLEREFNGETFGCLIAERRGVAFGFAIFYRAYSSWEQCSYMMIEDLHAFFGRRGTGTALFARLREIGEKLGYARIETRTQTTSRSMGSAAGFVEAMGMTSTLGLDWRIFRMELTPTVIRRLGL